MKTQKAIIIGGGPAGLTAAYELLKHTDVQPIVLEQSDYWGGISKTVNYKGNRIDIGGDRKSTRLNSSHVKISYAVFCLKKKNKEQTHSIQEKDADDK